MVVQHNITAMNSNRMLNVTTSAQAKSTEKLSSGYKINRSADDASGLSISEKMRKQMRGLTQASSNAQDGISTVQTAEGALNEVHDMLQRMNELAVKASNGTLSSSDRNDVQNEIDQLVTEVDRVSTTTKFNEIYLLKGNNEGSVGKLTYNTAGSSKYLNASGVNLGKVNSIGVATASLTSVTGSESGLDNTKWVGKKITVGSTTYMLVESTKATAASKTKSSIAEVVVKLNEGSKTKAFSSMDSMLSELKKTDAENIKSITTQVAGSKTMLRTEVFADLNGALDVSLHVGADSSDDNKIRLNINMMSARGLGINGLNVSGATADNATKAIDTIANAISKVSAQRSSLGAVQNRLEHTIKNLDNVVENTTAAESEIRDTDMAKEMVQFSKNNILAQAGQSMLAQANQSNQGVLSLLG